MMVIVVGGAIGMKHMWTKMNLVLELLREQRVRIKCVHNFK
jgi:hypothetical protein